MAFDDGSNGHTPGAPGTISVSCGSCGAAFEDKSEFCGRCGAPRPKTGPRLVVDLSEPEIRLSPARQLSPPTPPTTQVPLVTPVPQPPPPAVEAPTGDGDGGGGLLEDRRRLAIVGGSVAAGLLLLVLAAVLLWPEGSDVDITETVDAAAVTVTESVEELPEATLIEDYRAIGVAAAEQAEALSEDAEVVEDVGSEDLRVAAEDLLTAEVAVLASLGEALAEMQTANLPDWEERVAPVEDAIEELAAAQDDFTDLEFTEFETVAVVDVEEAEEAVVGVTEAMEDKLGRFNRWVNESTKVEKRKDRQQKALSGYRNRVGGLMDQYAAQRSDLQAFADRLDVEFVSIAEGVEVLSAASSARQGVLSELNTANPPDSVAAAHTSLVAVVGDGVAGVQSAQNGLSQYLNDPYYFYLSVEETPGWQEFQSASSRITTAFDAALANWNNAVEREANQLRNIKLPKQPKL